jgi:hypothetical protein
MEEVLISVAQRTLVAGTPLLLGTIGEIIANVPAFSTWAWKALWPSAR